MGRDARGRSASILASLVVVLLMAAGCGSGAPGERTTTSPEAAMATDVPTSSGPAGLECGAPLDPQAEGELRISVRFPATVAAAEQMASGTVEISASRSATRSAARGVVTPLAEAFLVREGRVVTLPVPQDAVGRSVELTEGRVEQLPAMVSLLACSGGQALASGTYDLYVRVVLNHEDGTRTDSLGGPWPLAVR